MGSVLIKNGRIWDGTDFRIGDVLTRDDRIEAIGNLEASADFIFDAEGKTVLPGLVDCHVHMKGISSDDFGIDAAMSCIPFGVTAAADASGCQGDGRLLDALPVKNRVFLCAGFQNNQAIFDSAETMLPRYGQGEIRPTVYKVLPMAQAEEAHAILQRGENVGKVVLYVRDEA